MKIKKKKKAKSSKSSPVEQIDDATKKEEIENYYEWYVKISDEQNDKEEILKINNL